MNVFTHNYYKIVKVNYEIKINIKAIKFKKYFFQNSGIVAL
jgi:hypothetical protein